MTVPMLRPTTSLKNDGVNKEIESAVTKSFGSGGMIIGLVSPFALVGSSLCNFNETDIPRREQTRSRARVARARATKTSRVKRYARDVTRHWGRECPHTIVVAPPRAFFAHVPPARAA